MKHTHILRGFRVFKKDSNQEVSLVKTLEDGRTQIAKLDLTKAITPDRCLELLKKSEERSGVDGLDKINIFVALWEYDDKEDFSEAKKGGYLEDLSAWNNLRDEYQFTKSDNYLFLSRTVGIDQPIGYEWTDDGFKRVDNDCNAYGDVLLPHSDYEIGLTDDV